MVTGKPHHREIGHPIWPSGLKVCHKALELFEPFTQSRNAAKSFVCVRAYDRWVNATVRLFGCAIGFGSHCVWSVKIECAEGGSEMAFDRLVGRRSGGISWYVGIRLAFVCSDRG